MGSLNHGLAIGVPATWFDGLSTRRHPVRLRLRGDTLEMVEDLEPRPDDAPPAAGPVRRYAVAALKPAERSRGAPLPLGTPDGGTLWLDSRAAVLADALMPCLWPKAPVGRVIASWPAVLLCLLLIVMAVVWVDRVGAGLVADAALQLMPRSVEQSAGDKAMAEVDKTLLQPSTLPLARRRALAARFVETAARLEPELIVRVEFRRLKNDAGFNAVSLPNGMIVVFDGLAEQLNDDELMAVLGHEMGHVVHRHAMRGAARSIGLLAVAGVVLGDFSTVAATAAATLQRFAYSRDAEREADTFAHRFMAEAGLPPTALLGVWRKLLKAQRTAGIDAVPDWLSTHPSTEERIRSEGAN